MDSRDAFVEGLRRLVGNTTGGLTEVAERAGVSEDNLKQILAGTRLKSGRPRGMGPNLRNRLDEAFPGWWQRVVPTPQQTAPKPLKDTLIDLATYLARSDDLTRKAVTPLLDRLVTNPEEAGRIAPRVEALLAAEPAAPYVATLGAEQERQREQEMLRHAGERSRKLREAARPISEGPAPMHANKPSPKRQ